MTAYNMEQAEALAREICELMQVGKCEDRALLNAFKYERGGVERVFETNQPFQRYGPPLIGEERLQLTGIEVLRDPVSWTHRLNLSFDVFGDHGRGSFTIPFQEAAVCINGVGDAALDIVQCYEREEFARVRKTAEQIEEEAHKKALLDTYKDDPRFGSW